MKNLFLLSYYVKLMIISEEVHEARQKSSEKLEKARRTWQIPEKQEIS